MIDKEILKTVRRELSHVETNNTKSKTIDFHYEKIKEKYNTGTRIFKLSIKTLFFAYKIEQVVLKMLFLKRTSIYFSNIYLNIIKKLYVIYEE